MAGPAAQRQLTALASRRAVRFTVAGLGDDAAIRQLLRANPMRGAISLSFEREPDYFGSTGIAGADDVTILAYEHQRLVCMGRCTTRPCWLNGGIRRVGYLGELRLAGSAQGRFDIMRGGYRFFQELHQRNPADFYFTSIAADNIRARRFFERGVAGLPRYEFLTDFVTVLVPVPATPGPPPCRLERAEAGDLDSLAAFLNAEGRQRQLAVAWTGEQLAGLARHGLPLEDFHLLKCDGRILACTALWDQRSFRQTVIRDYSPAIAWARPVHNLTALFTGSPKLPARDSILAHAFLAPFACGPAGVATLPDLIRSIFPVAAQRGLDFLTLGYPADDAALPALRRSFRCRTYASRIYRVVWPGEGGTALPLEPGPILPDVALL